MPNSITLTWFTPHRLTFTGPIPPNTDYITALKLSSKIDYADDLGPLSDEAAASITTLSRHLAATGKEITKPCDCPSLVELLENAALVDRAPIVKKAPSPSWSLQQAFTRQRVVGWSAVLGGGYIMYTTLREGWKAKEAKARGVKEGEVDTDAGRKWWMVLGGGMYVVGVMVLGMRCEDS